MKKQFPQMTNALESSHILCVFALWAVVFLAIPGWLPMIAGGFLENDAAIAWLETGFCALMGIAMLLIMKAHLTDMFQDMRDDWKPIAKASGIALVIMAAWYVISAELLEWMQIDIMFLVEALPISPTNLLMLPGAVVYANPVVGLLCMTLLVPFGVCGMFYASAFAPVCTRSKWAGYPVVAGAVLLAALLDSYWYWETDMAMLTLMVRLPMHLAACWSYQKTDNTWAPVFALAAFNLLTSVASIAMF